MNSKISTLLVVGVVAIAAGAVSAQAPKPAAPAAAPAAQAPAAKPRLVPPIRGLAQLGYTKPVVKGEKDAVITTFKVKNMDTGAIAGLKVEELWYDKAGNLVTGSDFRNPKPLQPGEVITITLNTRRDPNMDRNQYSFSHANGMIKATLQAKM
jgi:hypothetical protein